MRLGTKSDAAPATGGGVNPELEEAEAMGLGAAPSANWLRVPRAIPLAAGRAKVTPAPSTRQVRPSRYQAPRPRRLTAAEEREVARLAGWRSLRHIAREFGVSHESIRSIIRRTPVDALPPADAEPVVDAETLATAAD